MPPPDLPETFEYATKTVAVAAPTKPDIVIGGAINIRNPAAVQSRISKRLVIPGVGASKPFVEELDAGGATRISSSRLAADFGMTLDEDVEGFLVIRSSTSLDVVAVYTVGPRDGPARAIDVVHVPERRIATKAGQAAPGGGLVFDYAPKTVAVAAPTGPDIILGGAVNIRNPAAVSATISKRLLLPGVGVSDVFTEELPPGGATRITSRQMREGFGLKPDGDVEGFLVVQSPVSLDVVAVYTAGTRRAGVTAINVVHVPERKISRG